MNGIRLLLATNALLLLVLSLAASGMQRSDELPWCVNDARMDNPVQFTELTPEVTIRFVPTDDMDDGYYGWSVWEDDTCLVFAPMPEYEWGDIKMDTFGHEALHCFIGEFHE